MEEDNKTNYSDMILSFAKRVPVIGAMVAAGETATKIAKKIQSMQNENKIKPKIKPKPDIKPKPKPEKDFAKGGEVKGYMGGGSVHKKKNKMLTTKGWGASRKT